MELWDGRSLLRAHFLLSRNWGNVAVVAVVATVVIPAEAEAAARSGKAATQASVATGPRLPAEDTALVVETDALTPVADRDGMVSTTATVRAPTVASQAGVEAVPVAKRSR